MSGIARSLLLPREPRAAHASICVPGRNCWCLARASRVAFLVDGAAYFQAFAETVARARERIIVVGWDVQATTWLGPGPMPRGWPPTLREFLNAALAANPSLRAHVLDWDFSLLYALEREFLPVVQLGWLTHPRLEFRLDAEHPMAACHHQKIVVVDDSVAFVGGLDLTTNRWDTPAHRPDDPARRLPNGKPYAPFHDVQMAVSGEAAARLAALARARWLGATGERIRPVVEPDDPWPPDLEPDLRDVDVAIARTEPAFEGRPAVREVEALYLDSIAAARRWIYVENQYFTSSRIAAALAARLAEPDGPEIVLVGPRACSGWLEEQTMGTVRARLVRDLRAVDRHDRFRVYHPRLPGAPCDLTVHSKVMIVDDALVRVASSNLSNRSMGLDTECDLAIEARDDARVAAAIARLRDRLLAEHLGVPVSDVAAATAETGSLLATIERLAGGPRTLVPLCEDAPSILGALPDLVAPADPERPVAHAPFVTRVLHPDVGEPVMRTAVRAARALAGVLATALAWGWLGLGGRVLTAPPPAAVGTVALWWIVGTSLLVPAPPLVAASALLLGPRAGTTAVVLGAIGAAVVDYLAGRVLSRRRLARLVGPHLDRVTRYLLPGRVRDVVVTRLAAAAPFAVAGVVAGATRVALWRLVLGTLAFALPAAATAAWIAWAVGG